jgi:tetratricopeptide (TPR) repeat protein
LETAWALFEQAGDQRNACLVRSDIGVAYADLGEGARAAELLREEVAAADRLGLAQNAAISRRELARVLGWQGEHAEAERMVRQAVTTLGARGESREQAIAIAILAEILLSSGRLDEAAVEAERSAGILTMAPAARALALALLARARLGCKQVKEASVVAHEAYYGALESLGAMGEGETVVRLVYAECLLAGQDIEAAHLVLLRARERLLARAAALGARGDRRDFCANVPHNVQTLHLADSVLGPARGAVSDARVRREAK